MLGSVSSGLHSRKSSKFVFPDPSEGFVQVPVKVGLLNNVGTRVAEALPGEVHGDVA